MIRILVCSRIVCSLLFCLLQFNCIKAQNKVKQINIYCNNKPYAVEKYNEAGLLVQKEIFLLDEVMFEEHVYINDKLLFSVYMFRNNTIEAHRHYENNLLKIIRYLQNGVLYRQTTFQYNSVGLLIHETDSDAVTQSVQHIQYLYDSYMNLKEKIVRKDDETENRFINVWNDKKQIVAQLHLHDDDTIVNRIFVFENDRIVKQTEFVNGYLMHSQLFRYNKHHQLVEHTFLNEEGIIVRQEKIKYNRNRLLKSRIIREYRNFEGNYKPIREHYQYKYIYG